MSSVLKSAGEIMKTANQSLLFEQGTEEDRNYEERTGIGIMSGGRRGAEHGCWDT
jgi:hypothetical protein